VLVAVSKGLRPVKLICNRVLQFLTVKFGITPVGAVLMAVKESCVFGCVLRMLEYWTGCT